MRYVHKLNGEVMNWLAHYLRQKGMSASDLSRASGVHRQTIAKQLLKEALPAKWAETFSPFLAVSPQELMFGPPTGSVALKLVPVRGETAAGRWFEMDEAAELRYDPVPVVPGRYGAASQFAFRVVGNSMDLARIFDGDYAVCVPYFDARTKITDGDRVVIERRRGQLTERTCKQIAIIPNGFELWPRSSDPRHQSPIIVINPAESVADDGTEIEIVGLVVGTFAPMDG